MAKISVNDEIANLVKAGDVEVANNSFEDAEGNPARIRSMESTNDPLEVGDEITVPTDFKVLETKINDTTARYVVAEVHSVDGSERNMRFFPNSLAKTAYPVDEKGKRLAKVKTTGNVAEWAQGKTHNEVVRGLAGKTFKVTSKDSYTCKEYQKETTHNVNIFGYAWKD
jgi:hypothetical protein